MKRLLFLLFLIWGLGLVLSACGKKAPLPEGMEQAPICPEGFGRVEGAKSCEVIFTE